MTGLFERIGRNLLLRLDPETAHGLSVKALASGLLLGGTVQPDPRLRVTLSGLSLPNPLGMAAGYDKNGEVPDALLGLGFGFVEVGSITPRPQAGNPRPRIFRLTQDHAVINRLGFNNQGHDVCAGRLVLRAGRPGIVGINIGANKDSKDRIGDYEAGVRRFSELAAYLAVNVSSPNTPGLRNLQARGELAELLARVTAARAALPAPAERRRPIFLKIAPDLSENELDDIAAAVLASSIEGVIVSNTTLSRAGLSPNKSTEEAGGLSGKPLFSRSTAILACLRKRLGPDKAIIGAGGVDSVETMLEKIKAGADAVQLYTGLIYGGPGLPARILRETLAVLDRERVASIGALRDTRMRHWAGMPL